MGRESLRQFCWLGIVGKVWLSSHEISFLFLVGSWMWIGPNFFAFGGAFFPNEIHGQIGETSLFDFDPCHSHSVKGRPQKADRCFFARV